MLIAPTKDVSVELADSMKDTRLASLSTKEACICSKDTKSIAKSFLAEGWALAFMGVSVI